jgi:hypothetical protein
MLFRNYKVSTFLRVGVVPSSTSSFVRGCWLRYWYIFHLIKRLKLHGDLWHCHWYVTVCLLHGRGAREANQETHLVPSQVKGVHRQLVIQPQLLLSTNKTINVRNASSVPWWVPLQEVPFLRYLRVQFECRAPETLTVWKCNCSICYIK